MVLPGTNLHQLPSVADLNVPVILAVRSLRAVDRNGYCRFRTNEGVKGKAAARRQRALDTLICSENRVAVAIDGFSRTLL